MGNKSSKIAQSAASPKRQYPTRIPPIKPTASPQAPTIASQVPPSPSPPTGSSAIGPTVHPHPSASSTKSQSIKRDAADPDFDLASSLRTIGPVKNPASTYSATSIAHVSPSNRTSTSPQTSPLPNSIAPSKGTSENFSLRILSARERLNREAEADSQSGRHDRRYVDAQTVKKILVFQEKGGLADEAIDEEVGLRAGTSKSLRGAFGLPIEGRARSGIEYDNADVEGPGFGGGMGGGMGGGFGR